MSFERTRLLACLALCAACSGQAAAAKSDSPAAPTASDTEAASDTKPAQSWVADSVARIRVDTGDAGGMRGCTGTLTPEAKAFFATAYDAAATCAAQANPPAKGSITFHSTLEDGGGISEFSVLDDKLAAPKVVECIQMRVLGLEYPKVDPKTPCVQLVHPLTFE